MNYKLKKRFNDLHNITVNAIKNGDRIYTVMLTKNYDPLKHYDTVEYDLIPMTHGQAISFKNSHSNLNDFMLVQIRSVNDYIKNHNKLKINAGHDHNVFKLELF